MTEYNLRYRDVTCLAVDWENDVFVLDYADRVYNFKPIRYISQSADTDHIRCVIDQFLEVKNNDRE